MRTRTIFRAAAGLALAAALAFGCAEAVAPRSGGSDGPWSVSVSTAGGFSGGGGGTTVLSTGEAYSERWDVAGDPVVKTPLGTVPPRELSALYEVVRSEALHDAPAGQPANMTTTLIFDSASTKHIWYFEYLSEPPAAVGHAIERFEAAVRAAR